jgi:hypothetical protein
MTSPLVGGATFNYAPEIDGAIVWAWKDDGFTDQEAFNERSEWHPRLVNIDSWEGEEIDDAELGSKGWMGETMVVDGRAYFTVGTNGGSGDVTGGALMRYESGELKELIRFGEWLQVVQRIR